MIVHSLAARQNYKLQTVDLHREIFPGRSYCIHLFPPVTSSDHYFSFTGILFFLDVKHSRKMSLPGSMDIETLIKTTENTRVPRKTGFKTSHFVTFRNLLLCVLSIAAIKLV